MRTSARLASYFAAFAEIWRPRRLRNVVGIGAEHRKMLARSDAIHGGRIADDLARMRKERYASSEMDAQHLFWARETVTKRVKALGKLVPLMDVGRLHELNDLLDKWLK